MRDATAIVVGGAALLGVLLILRAFTGFRTRPGREARGATPEWAQGQPSADAGGDAPSADLVYLDEARRQLDTQVATLDSLDGRMASTVGAGSFVIPLAFGFLALSERRPPGLAVILLAAAIAAYLGVLIMAAGATRFRALEYRPNLAALRDNSQEFEGIALRRWVAEEYAASTELNRPELARKSVFVGRAIRALYVEGFLVGMAALATLLL